MNVKSTIYYILCILTIMSSLSTAAVQVVPRGNESSAESKEKSPSADNFKKEFGLAVKAYRKQIKNKWPNSEISSESRLVLYTPNFNEKYVIDFKADELQISMPTIKKRNNLDYKSMRQSLKESINKLLGMTLLSAINQDPVNRHLESVAGIRFANGLGSMGNDLILSELFQNEQPSITEIFRMAERLTKTAYIRYPAVASLHISFAFNEMTTYIVPLPKKRIKTKAKQFKPFVFDYAKKYDLPPSLVFAIIHTESHFNPLARSRAPAFGLMQIVPHTAGLDASNLLFNRNRILSPSYLYNPKKNVEVGTAYFHILYYRYLGEIKDPNARLYCAIAAYNTGIQNVVKSLTGIKSLSRGIPKINRMNSQEVLQRLLKQLPSSETREYLSKVLKLQKDYAKL